MLTWKRLALSAGAFFILSLLFITLILPEIVINRAERWVADETGRSLAIESLSINPFSLSVEVRKLSLSDSDQTKPFASWALLRVSLSTASIYHRAPVIDDLRLEQPMIHLERLTADTFNFSDLIPPKDENHTSGPEEDKGAVRFSVNNISINNGRIELVDSSLDEPVQHTISDLQLVLPSIGNLPYMVENPSQPLFKAVVNDSPIDIEGHLKPFSSSQEMQFRLDLENIDIPFYLGYVPVELPVDIRNGKLNLGLDILYRVSPETGNEVILSGQVDLVSLNIWDNLQKQLFFLPLLQVEIAPTRPLEQDIHLSSLRIYNLEVQLDRDKNGNWNHARMADPKKTAPVDAETDNQQDSPLKLAIDTVEIRDGVVVFLDNLPGKSFQSVAREINIDVQDFALDASNGIPLSLTLETDRDETLVVDGHFLLTPFTLDLHTQIKDLDVAAYESYYADFYSVPLGGKLDARINLAINPEIPFLITDSELRWRNAYMAFNESEGLGVELLEMQGIFFDLAKNRLEITSYHGDNGKVKFSRDKQGSWSVLSGNFPVLAKLAEAPGTTPPPPTKSEGPEFSYRIGELAFNNWQFDIQDQLPLSPVDLQARNFNLSFRELAAPEAVQSPFDFTTDFGRRGKVSLQGTLSLAKQTMALEGQLKRIALATFAPYVAEETNLVLANGFLNANFESRLITPAPLDFQFGGQIGINQLHLLDGTHREDLLKWDSLQVAGLKGAYTPLELNIESITLSDYFAKVLIDEEARLNLVEAFRKDGEENIDTNEVAEDQTVQPPPVEAETEAQEIRIGKVVLQGGQVDFTDQNLPKTFHADMRDLGGRIEGLDSSAEARADVDLRGTLRGQSPLNITGSVNPLAEDLFLDLELSFRDIDMSPFSPYSGNFVGYLIEKGKLNLALDYSIEDNQLKASNKVFLDQFSFGEAVESENATALPVKLAVALLKDGNGEIHLDIPVYGSLDDPQFSIGGVVWTVIKNLLIKAATSPFALLGAIIGGDGGEDFSSISFDHGAARLNANEQDKLLRMAQALLDRPSLDVEVSGFIDPENDPEGYRWEQLSAKVKRLKYLDLVKAGELPEGTLEENVTIPSEEYEDYLWKIYKAEDFPKPRNFIGMTKKIPVAEMEKLIYTNTEVKESQLAKLAQARALAVQNFLTDSGQLPPERIFLKEPDITAAPDNETTYRARVELGASVK